MGTFWRITRWARAARFWLLLLLAFAAWAGFGAGEARAAICGIQTQTELYAATGGSVTYPLRVNAYQACAVAIGQQFYATSGQGLGTVLACDQDGTSKRHRLWVRWERITINSATCAQTSNGAPYEGGYSTGWSWSGQECPPGESWSDTIQGCSDCAARQPRTGGWTPPNGTMTCERGNDNPPRYCVYVYHYNGDGTSTGIPMSDGACIPQDFAEECNLMPGMYWSNAFIGGGACVPIDPPECDEGETLGPDNLCRPESCPPGMRTNAFGVCEPDQSQCPAGQVRGPDGACTGDADGDGKDDCPAGQVRGADGTCKRDDDGDGEEDDPERREFSGGDDCNSPPLCSGDPIMCGQARIQWRTECHLRRDFNLSGGTCESPPVCEGRGCNAMEYAQLIQQWKTACAAAQGGGVVPGDPNNTWDANGNGIPDVLEGHIAELEVEQGEVGTTGDDAWGDVDTGGWLGGGGCPGLPNVLGPELGAMACQQGGYIQWLMRLLALVFAGAIIGRAASGSA